MICALVLASVVACKIEEPPPPVNSPPPAAPAAAAGPAKLATVKVSNAGVISYDGKTVKMEDVKAILADPSKRPTEIEYSRDRSKQPTATGAPIVHELLQTLVDSKVSIRMASK